MALSSLGDTSGLPSVLVGPEGLYVVSWPAGRPEEVSLTVGLFEALLEDLNNGRRAINVLGVIASAFAGLVPSASTTTGEPAQQHADTP